MGDHKSLSGSDAISKIKELAEDKVCLLCTYMSGDIVSRPMHTSGIDEDGTIWFLSKKDSDKNRQISNEDKVYLMYLDTGKNHYLSLTGKADIIIDKSKTEELWTPMAKAWFEEGIDDPELTLIKVTITDGHYWDTKNGKLLSLLKIAGSVLSGGGKDDGGVDGALKV